MKNSKILKAISYIVLPITIAILILSIICIGMKNSSYYDKESYFSSERFVTTYMQTISEVASKLIHNNNLYESVQDGDMEIFYLHAYYYSDGSRTMNYSDYTNTSEINFLIIYKNKAITNVNLKTIDDIKSYIDASQETKKVNIINGKIESDSEVISKSGNRYLGNFTIPYYTTDTESTDIRLSDGTYIEYITPNIQDFEIYSSYVEELYQTQDRIIATELLNKLSIVEKDIYIALPISAILSILIIVYLIIAIGHKKGKDGISLNDFDKIPLEIIIIIGAFLIGLSFIPFGIGVDENEFSFDLLTSSIATAYAVSYIITAITLHTIIKRIKSKTFWKTTLLGKMAEFIEKCCNKLIKKIRAINNTLVYSTKIKREVIIYCLIRLLIGLFILLIFGKEPIGIFLEIILIGSIIYKVIRITKEYSQIEDKLKDMNDGNNQIKLDETEFIPEFRNTVRYINEASAGVEKAIQERIKSERLKAELITNVSHDIKTPLTSIINYVDLLKKENIENEKAKEYINILDNKSQRLKKLTEDLVEASKVSTGNISLNLEKINIVELIKQASGEFEDKFKIRKLETIIDSRENEIYIMADSRYMYRIIENLFSNVSKYALESSRVYIDIQKRNKEVIIEMKNISKDRLNISAEELMQRFVRGDKSRTTEGSGLGISIAQNLTELQKGKFNLKLDGDLFKVELIFNII